MGKSRVQELAEEVKDEARRGDLAPVRSIIDPRQGYAALQAEVLSEMAGALGRAERRVNEAIARLGELVPGSDEHERQRQRALRLRRDLLIHREALRFPPDPRFSETYPIPKKRARR